MENMAPSNRHTHPLLEDILYSKASAFSFHAAMKALETMDLEHPQKLIVQELMEAPVSVQVHPSFAMPNADLETLIAPRTSKDLSILRINFMGIETRQGPLPDPYIEELIHNFNRGNTAFHAFLSIFNNRLAHLFHGIRKKYWIGISTKAPEKTPYGKSLSALIGVDGKFLENRLRVPDRSLLYYANFFWQKPRTLPALEKILSHFFATPIKAESCTGQWHCIPLSQRTKIGTTGQFQRLGTTTVLGERFWDQQSAFHLRIPNLDLKTFIDFLKPGPKYKSLLALTTFYASPQYNFYVTLGLKKEEVPKMRLGKGAALGWTTWLKVKAFTRDATVTLNNNPQFQPMKSLIKGGTP